MIDLRGLLDRGDGRPVQFRSMGRDPQRGLDCWGLCRLLHIRGGRPVPEVAEAGDYTVGASAEALDSFLTTPGAAHWSQVAWPYRELDVLELAVERGRVHLYTVVSTSPCLAASCTRGIGVHLADAAALAVHRAWRLRP